MAGTDSGMDRAAFGRRVAFHRKKRGYSQREFAAMIDRSETWLSQVERGVRRIDRMSVLERLAGALDVPLVELAPQRSVVAVAHEVPQAAVALSLAMSSSEALRAVLSAGPPVDPAELEERSARAWDYAHGCRYDELATVLVGLLPDLEQAQRHGDVAELRRVSIAKVQTYHAAAAALCRLGESAGAWVAVDRAIRAAQDAGDPLLMAEGAFRLTIVFQAARRFELAGRVAASAVEAIGELVAEGDPAAVAMQGALYLQLAVAAARSYDADTAYAHLDAAHRAGALLGEDRNDYHTEFGPTNVLLHEVAVAVELGDAGRALRVAGGIDVAWLSGAHRASLLIDVAWAQAQVRRPEAVVSALSQAMLIAPEQTRTHRRVHELVADLLRGDHRGASEVKELAALLRIGPDPAA